MNRLTLSELINSLRTASLQLFGLLAQFFQYLMALPLPKLLMVCLAAALILSILPLAFTLLIGFLLIKLVVLLFVLKPKQANHQ
ncbi:hypothetical protein [Undibacterium sp. Ren11W]|uniref:hypothetical protein n=1 Tax=Undibacterium sp. Ren11W TaxID=3413045 RepID=UPI003BF18E48